MVLTKRDGRLTGEALVLLSNPMHVDLALAKDRSYLGRRYIEIAHAKKPVSVLSLPFHALRCVSAPLCLSLHPDALS